MFLLFCQDLAEARNVVSHLLGVSFFFIPCIKAAVATKAQLKAMQKEQKQNSDNH